MRKRQKKNLREILSELGLFEDDDIQRKWIYINNEKTTYQILSNGEVISLEYQGKKRKHPLSMSGGLDKNGYHIVSITFQKKKYTCKVHRLVAEAFIPNPNNYPEVNHKNGNKIDNRASNLEWVTTQENTQHAGSVGLRYGSLTEGVVRKICELLSTNKYSYYRISEMTGVSKSNVYKILKKYTWTNISKEYDIDNYNPDNHPISFKSKNIPEDTLIKIANDLMNNRGTMSEISRRYSVTVQTVSRIYRKELHKNLLADFDFSNFKKGVNQYSNMKG